MIAKLNLDANATVLLSVAAMWLAGFLMTRLTKALRLPNVTGYILAGVLAGPYVLGLVPQDVTAGMDFLTDAALGFIAFGVGRYLRLDALRRSGIKIVVLTLMEALVAAAAVVVAMRLIFGLPLSFCLLLGAIGSATAPASSLMTIRQYRAKGEFVRTLIQVVALDDVVALLAFSVSAAVVSGGQGGAQTLLLPLLDNALALAAALLLGWLLGLVITEKRSPDHALTLVCAAIFGLAALSAALGVSPLLGSMVMGAVYANMHEDKRLFKAVHRFTPPLMMLFFVLSGMRLDVPSLATAGWIGLAYFLVRIVGKFAGAYLGSRLIGAPDSVRKYLGLTLIPQAGVSIGLAVLGQRMLPAQYGSLLSTIILSSSVLYEMIGPVCAKRGLTLSGAINPGGASRRGDEPRKNRHNNKKGGASARKVSEKKIKAADGLPVPAVHYAAATQRLYPMRKEKWNARRV